MTMVGINQQDLGTAHTHTHTYTYTHTQTTEKAPKKEHENRLGLLLLTEYVLSIIC